MSDNGTERTPQKCVRAAGSRARTPSRCNHGWSCNRSHLLVRDQLLFVHPQPHHFGRAVAFGQKRDPRGAQVEVRRRRLGQVRVVVARQRVDCAVVDVCHEPRMAASQDGRKELAPNKRTPSALPGLTHKNPSRRSRPPAGSTRRQKGWPRATRRLRAGWCDEAAAGPGGFGPGSAPAPNQVEKNVALGHVPDVEQVDVLYVVWPFPPPNSSLFYNLEPTANSPT
jgi:hypothetical protein